MATFTGGSKAQAAQLSGVTTRVTALESSVATIQQKITVNINDTITTQIYDAIERQVPAAITTQASQIIYDNLQQTILDTESALSQSITSKIAQTVADETVRNTTIINDLTANIDAFKSENTSQHNALQTSINNLSDRETSHKAELDATIATLDAREATHKSELDATIATLDAREASHYSEVTASIATLTNAGASDKAELQSNIDTLDAREAADKVALDARIAAQETKEAADKAELIARIAAQETKEAGDVSDLQSQLNTLDTREVNSTSTITSRVAALEVKEQGDVDTLTVRVEAQEIKEQNDIDTLTTRVADLETKEQADVDTLTTRVADLETKEQGDIDTLTTRVADLENTESAHYDDLSGKAYIYEKKFYAIEQYIRLMVSTYNINDANGQPYVFSGEVQGNYWVTPMFGMYGKIGTGKIVIGHEAFISRTISFYGKIQLSAFNGQPIGFIDLALSPHYTTLTLGRPLVSADFPLSLDWNDSRSKTIYTYTIDEPSYNALPTFDGDILQWGSTDASVVTELESGTLTTGVIAGGVEYPVTMVTGPIKDDDVAQGETAQRYKALSQSFILLPTTSTTVTVKVDGTAYDIEQDSSDRFWPGAGYTAWVYNLTARDAVERPNGRSVNITQRTPEQDGRNVGGVGMYLAVVLEKIDTAGAHLGYAVSFTRIEHWSLIGEASGGWGTDVDLTPTADTLVFSASGVPFTQGQFKIRANHDWNGGPNSRVLGGFFDLEMSWNSFTTMDRTGQAQNLYYYGAPASYDVTLNLKNIGYPSLRLEKSA